MDTSTITWPREDNRVPREIYLDNALYDREMERVFAGPVWSVVAHDAELPEAGDFKTTWVGSIPVVVLRGSDGMVRVLVNACAHRGARVVTESSGNIGSAGHLRCVYHAWTYGFDGRLVSASLEEEFPEGFCKADYGLVQARVGTYCGLVFASLSGDAPTLEQYLGGLCEGLECALGDGRLRLLGSQRVIFECNWKIYVENIYDGYHTVSLHKAFRLLQMKAAGGTIDSPGYERSGHVWNEYLTLPLENHTVMRDESILETRTKNPPANRILNVFPASIISDQVDTLAVRYVIPRGPERTEVDFTVFARADDSEEIVAHRVGQGSNLFGPEGFITLEDATALARVQQSAAARGDNVVLKGAAKRFPPYRIIDEAAIRHFYAAYRRVMEL